MTPLHIIAAAEYVAPVDIDTAEDLKPLVHDATGAHVRRISRFIQLALIGAGRSARGTQVTKDTAVYVGSSQGDLETIIDVLRAVLRDGLSPRPLSFINTVSNAACFYVAQTLTLLGRSTFVCNRYFAFESVLQLAVVDLLNHDADQVLLGTVDVVVPPLSEHRARLGLDGDAAVADASHWIAMSREAPARSLCRVLAARTFSDSASLSAWIRAQPQHEQWMLSTGQFMDRAEAERWSPMFTAAAFDYRPDRPHYDSQSGALIHRYVDSAERRALLHINCDPSQRYSVMLLDKG